MISSKMTIIFQLEGGSSLAAETFLPANIERRQ